MGCGYDIHSLAILLQLFQSGFHLVVRGPFAVICKVTAYENNVRRIIFAQAVKGVLNDFFAPAEKELARLWLFVFVKAVHKILF